MKIAYIINSFPILSETFIANQMIDVIKKGHEISIFSFNKIPPPYHARAVEFGLVGKMVHIDLSEGGKIKKLIKCLGLLKSPRSAVLIIRDVLLKRTNVASLMLALEIKKLESFDVLHAHFGNAGLIMVDLRRWGIVKKTTRLVTTFHGYDLNKATAPFIADYRKLYEHCDIFTVNSAYSRELALKIGCPRQKIVVLPVGLDTNYFKPESPASHLPKKTLQIVFIGRLIPLKGPLVLLDICEELKRQNIDFFCTIIGDGELLSDVQQKIHEKKLGENIAIKGELTQEEIVRVAQSCDLFLYPAIYDDIGRAETQGLVIQEAQAMELPVVVSDVGGIQEGVKNGVTGFVIPSKEIYEFVEKIKYLINNPMERLEMGKAARQFVVKNFDSSVLGERLQNIYSN